MQAHGSGRQKTSLATKMFIWFYVSDGYGPCWTSAEITVVPHAGIEPALLSELDFESSASTSSANGAGTVVIGGNIRCDGTRST